MQWAGDRLGNLRNYSTEEDIESALRKNYPSDYPEDKYPGNDIKSIKIFYQSIKEGDVIVAKKGASREVYGIGKVLHEYHFDEARESFKHVIDVDWIIGFDDRVEVETSKEFVRWTTNSLKPVRFDEVKKSILRKYPELDEKFYLLMEISRAARKWWIEKTLVKGRPDRETGEYALGKALWSPQSKRGGGDIYKNMRETKQGDVILHLIDNKAIVGISIVDKECDANFFCLPGTAWDDGTGKRPGYLVTLKDYQKFKNPIDRSDVLNEKNEDKLLSLLEKGHYLFYNRDLELNQGAYLTEAPSSLVQIINDIYKEKNEQDLPFWAPSTTAPPPSILPLILQPSLIQTELELDPEVLERICANLNAGSHIIVTGPVGTGKTSLAEDVCRAAKENNFCNGYVLTTATSDWTTFDTIGGYMPTEEGKLGFEEGKFLSAIRQNKWLIIDEINRADIDKAFGQLFTVLSGQKVELPFKDTTGSAISIETTGEEKSYFDDEKASYNVGKNWRIISTMNVYDKSFLFEMSYAFMRRFAFVYLDVPERFDELIEEWCKGKKISEKTREKLELLTKLGTRKIGPAIIKDIIGYIEHRGDGEKELAEAIVAYILPQLEGLEEVKIRKTWEKIVKIFEIKDLPSKLIKPIFSEIVGFELEDIV